VKDARAREGAASSVVKGDRTREVTLEAAKIAQLELAVKIKVG
jgi:hypothetical protein